MAKQSDKLPVAMRPSASAVHLSVVSPVYGAQGIIDELVRRVTESVTEITDSYEIILIEDHSPDRSWQEIEAACAADKHVVGVKLSRNFGQHNAIAAAMELARGDVVVLLDCDLQHDPAYIPQLYAKLNEGHDLVFGRLQKREHGAVKNLTARLYYKFFKTVSGFDMDPNIGSFTMLRRNVVDAYNTYNDYRKTYLMALQWVGFDKGYVEVEHRQRYAGSSGYGMFRLFKHALSVTLANSDRPLYASIYAGIGISALAMIGSLLVMWQYFSHGAMDGWSSLMVAIMFATGVILTSLGVLGLYMAMIYEQTKDRPRYLVSKALNADEF